MKSRLLAITLIIVITLSACRFATGLVGGSGAAQKYQYIFGAPTNPIQLTTSLDAGHSTEAFISGAGGTLSATGADGTVYDLEIPPKALLGGTKITMTPVASLSGLPFGGTQTLAVQLEPEGLYLYQDAILTITPPSPIPLGNQLFFDYQGDGQTVGLAAPVVESKDLKIRLMHFSGYGVVEISAKGLGSPAGSGAQDVYLSDTAAVQGQLGGDTVAAVESLAGEVEAQKRQNEQNGDNQDVSAETQAILDLIDQYEQQEVAPALQSAGDSCEASKDAIAKVLRLERARQLMGISSGMGQKAAADLSALISQGAITCVKEEYQRCVDEHHINGMIPFYVGLMRMHALLGSSEGGAEPEDVTVAKDLTTKCLTFELQFHSEGSFDTGDGGYKSAVDGKITLQFNPDTFTIDGSGPLDNLSFEFRPPAGGKGMKCTAKNQTGGSTFEGKSLEYIEDTRSPTDPERYVRDFKLLYFPGVTSESYNIHCDLIDSQGKVTKQDYAALPSGYWTGIFFVLHQDELNGSSPGPGLPSIPDMSGLQIGALPAMPAPAMPADGGFIATDWTVTPGDALMASKEWIKDDSATSTTETGTLKLYHRPGG